MNVLTPHPHGPPFIQGAGECTCLWLCSPAWGDVNHGLGSEPLSAFEEMCSFYHGSMPPTTARPLDPAVAAHLGLCLDFTILHFKGQFLPFNLECPSLEPSVRKNGRHAHRSSVSQERPHCAVLLSWLFLPVVRVSH